MTRGRYGSRTGPRAAAGPAHRRANGAFPAGGRGYPGEVWPGGGRGRARGGRGAGRSLAVEQEPPPFWFRCLGSEHRAEAAAGRSGSRPGPVRAGGREDAARRSPSSAPAVLSLTR